MINRTIAPPIIDPIAFDVTLPMCKTYALSNGVEIYALDMGTEDILMIDWVFSAGNWFEKKKGVASTANFLLKNGTSKRSAFDISEHFDFYGSYLNRSCYNETADITLHTLSKHASELLPVVAEMIQDSVFPQDELNIHIQNAQQRLKVNLQKSEFVAGRLIDAYLYGEQHPYGVYMNLEDYAAVTREDVSSFYDTYYKNGRCVIFVAGRLPNDLVENLEKYFGHLPLRSHKDKGEDIQHPVRPAVQKKHHIMNDPNGVQSAIRIARPFPNRHHPDFQKILILNHVFGGFFGSRLMDNIREDKGYTYGIYSYLLNFVNESGWVVSTEAGRTVTEETVKEIYKEMERLRNEPVEEGELMMTRNLMIGSILGDLDGPFQVIARWKNMVLNGLDENYFYRSIQLIKTVTAEELQELANKYLVPGDFYELVVI